MGESFVVVWLGEWGSLKTGGDGFSFATPLRYAGCLWGWLANGVRNGVAHPTANLVLASQLRFAAQAAERLPCAKACQNGFDGFEDNQDVQRKRKVFDVVKIVFQLDLGFVFVACVALGYLRPA